MRRIFGLFLCVLVFVAAENQAQAHHLWVEKTGDTYRIARGMFLERLDPYRPDAVTEVIAVGMDGEVLPAGAVERSNEATQATFRVDALLSAVGVVCDWGYRVNTTRGKKLIRRSDAEKTGLRVVDAFFSTQYAKVLFSGFTGAVKPIRLKFEMVVIDDPSLISAGKPFRVQVLFEGRPVAGATLFMRGGGEIAANGQGIAAITPSKKGLQLVMARIKIPATGDPDMDYHLHTTFLVVEVPR